MVQIAIFGERYSENLGDAVISDSLVWLLRQIDPGICVSCVDLAGRRGFDTEELRDGDGPSGLRRIHRLLMRIPPYRNAVVDPLRRAGAFAALWYCSKRNRVKQIWREKIRQCDLVVIGGGQLLMDNELDFPLKVRELVRIAHELQKGVAFYACGVGKRWSRLGVRLLSQSLFDERVLCVSVRDHGSRNTLQGLFPNSNLECRVFIDPAVCAAEVYGIKADYTSSTVGLGVCAPTALRRRASSADRAFSLKRVSQFWLQLAELLASDDRAVAFFTNGNTEDYAFAQSIIAQIPAQKRKKRACLLERPRDPRTLTAQIARFGGIVAHRLHANIVAYSLGIPSVGLVWDKKLEEFGRITGRSRFYLDPGDMDSRVARQRLYAAVAAGVAPSRLRETKTSAAANVRSMLSSIGIG